MKKIYTLLVAVLVAVTASAQVSVQSVNLRQSPIKAKKSNAVDFKKNRSISDETWIHYPAWDATYWAVDSIADGMAVYLKSDSMGLYSYSNGMGHPWVHSISQTYDFTSTFFDELIGNGSMSFTHTPKLNLDSVMIQGMYIRNEGYTATDTLVIGIYTVEAPVSGAGGNVYQFTHYANTCFLSIDADHASGVQDGAIKTISIPLTDADVSQPAEQEGYYYYANFYVPVNMENITDKVWNVAYTFKSGQNPSLNDTLKSQFSAYFAKSANSKYFINDTTTTYRCDNMSHGQYILTFSNSGLTDFYYPGFAIGENSSEADFPEGIRIKVSCTECEVVNVKEIEKNNITVYPNPATDKFTVKLENNETAQVQLFNIVGQQVYSATINGSEEISTSKLNSGVYMLKVNQNGKVYTSKVIVR